MPGVFRFSQTRNVEQIPLRPVRIGIIFYHHRLIWRIDPALGSEKSSIWIQHRIHNRDICPYDPGRYSITGKQYTSVKYGINFTEIIEHLKPFPKDIKNYQIDHIIPLSLFDFNNPVHIKKAFAPSNHQWLTKIENISKGNKLIMPHVHK